MSGDALVGGERPVVESVTAALAGEVYGYAKVGGHLYYRRRNGETIRWVGGAGAGWEVVDA